MHGGSNEQARKPDRKPGRDRHGDRARKDAWFARRQAQTCLRFEVDRPGRAMFIDVGPGPEPYWLPRGEAVPYCHALRILVRCDGDLSRIQAAARLCRRRASGTSPAPNDGTEGSVRAPQPVQPGTHPAPREMQDDPGTAPATWSSRAPPWRRPLPHHQPGRPARRSPAHQRPTPATAPAASASASEGGHWCSGGCRVWSAAMVVVEFCERGNARGVLFRRAFRHLEVTPDGRTASSPDRAAAWPVAQREDTT
jgi:hypothetical protein